MSGPGQAGLEPPKESDPLTFVGRWLLADALDRRDARATHVISIRRTGGWTLGRVALVDNALRVAARQHFTRKPSATDLRDFVRNAIDHFGQPAELRYLEIEWKLREALGEHLPIETIDFRRSFLASRLIFTYAVDQSALSASSVGRILVEAEGLTVADGLEPLTPEERGETGVTVERLRERGF